MPLRTEEPTVPRLGKPFNNGKRRPKRPDLIVLHESVTNTLAACEAVLRRRGLGVHYVVDEHGQVWAFDDAASIALAHAGKLNTRSIGVELINPYYPESATGPWKEHPVNRERWAHRGRYVMPSPEALEALYRLILSLCVEHAIPARVVSTPEPGILAHGASPFDSHADGYAPAEYCAARLAGATPAQAYAKLSEDQ